jgi:hypothetical protein
VRRPQQLHHHLRRNGAAGPDRWGVCLG